VDGWPSYIGVQTGAGVVVVTAFDVGGFPFRGWSGAPAFWQVLLSGLKGGPRPGWRRAGGNTYYPGQSSPERSVLQVLSAMTAKAAPVLLIVVLVGLYVLCVGPLNYLFLRDYRRRVWLVLTTPLVALVFVVVVAAVGVLGRGFSALTLQMTFLTLCGDVESAYQRSYVGVWCPASGSFDLASGVDYFVQPLTAGSQPARWERIGATRFAERNVLEDCSFRVRELRCFQVDAVRPLGGRLILRREGKDLVLENDTDLDLRGAYTESRGQTILFGDLVAGESGRGRVRPSSAGRWNRTEWLQGVAPEWVPRTEGGRRGRVRVPRLLSDIEDEVTGMVVRSTAGRVYRIEAAVENLEEPVRLSGGRVRSHRELVLLRAYLVAE